MCQAWCYSSCRALSCGYVRFNSLQNFVLCNFVFGFWCAVPLFLASLFYCTRERYFPFINDEKKNRLLDFFLIKFWFSAILLSVIYWNIAFFCFVRICWDKTWRFSAKNQYFKTLFFSVQIEPISVLINIA